MADDDSSLGFLRQHPGWLGIGLAGAAGSVWGKRLGEDRPLLGYIVFVLGLVLIAIGHGWAINSAYVRFAGPRGVVRSDQMGTSAQRRRAGTSFRHTRKTPAQDVNGP
jgi:hypothetical protein